MGRDSGITSRVLWLLLPLLLLGGGGAVWANDARRDLKAAEGLARDFAVGRVTAFHGAFSPDLAASRPLDRLEELQRQLGERLGPVSMILAAYPIPPPSGATRSAAVPVEYRRGSLEIVLAWRGPLEPGSVVDFAIRPPKRRPSIATAPSQPSTRRAEREAPYVYRTQFREESVAIRRPGLGSLQGALALPTKASEESPVPGVVLLGERLAPSLDGDVGYLRPKRDLALGLASQGIATIRFPLRTPQTSGWTLGDLQLEDAREALRLLHRHEAVDPERLYILGHEIGGITAARLASQATAVRGLILLGSPSHWGPQWELARIEHASSLTGMPGEEEVSRIRGDMNLFREGRLPARAFWNHAPWTFWEDLRRRDAIADLTEYEGRLLYIVPRGSHLRSQRDLDRWQHLLGGLPDARAVAHDVGHWFQPLAGRGRDSPLAPLERTHVSLDVLDEIAAWIKADGP